MSGLADELRAVEATLFAAEHAMTAEQIRAYVGDAIDIPAALAVLEAHYVGRGIELVRRGQAWRFQTAPDLGRLLRRERKQLRRLSRAGVETLAIIAYHEPVSRAEIEAIRGVQISKGTLDVLMEAGWVRPTGRREVPGRPLIYATTPEFLVYFGLESRRDLPGIDELKAAGLLDPVDEAFDALDFDDPDRDGVEDSERRNDDLLESGADNA
ncbi:SMC-Scp complex subunit ScpB [Novosphingopyxis sp.]|uniref:SMC-Scp complex subunit ScpB n=1 Tax=Novosphingopyxis sp. TaxID=2709690 RepID=UPI003B59707E